MVIFTSSRRRRPGVEAGGRELPEDVRQALPARFEAVGEALVSAADTRPSCAAVGRDVARDGAGLGEALDGLRTTFDLVVGVEPDLASVESLSVAWGEATLEFLHSLSCEDPLTGMVSLAHLRTRLGELYREAAQSGEPVSTGYALVVAELSVPGTRLPEHRFTRVLHLVQVSRMLRSVFPGGQTIARLAEGRAVVVVRRLSSLGASVAMLRDLVGGLDLGTTHVRIWIEGLPDRDESARRLLDELARS